MLLYAACEFFPKLVVENVAEGLARISPLLSVKVSTNVISVIFVSPVFVTVTL